MPLVPVCARCGRALVLPAQGARVRCADCGTEAFVSDLRWKDG